MKVANEGQIWEERQRYGRVADVDIGCGPRKLYQGELMHIELAV